MIQTGDIFMQMYPVWATFWILFSLASCALDHGGDIGSNPRIFETTRLPKDRFMPSVGNGHVATVLHSVTIFMNGLYNGERGESHRARIPSHINIRVQATTEQPRRFILDTERGIFVEKLIVNDVQIEQTTFAHRLYTPLMVVQITANFSRSVRTSVAFNLTDNPGPDSSDITFSKPHKFRLGPGKEQNGTTKVVEDSKYQPYPTPVYVIYSDVPETVTLTKDSPIVTFVMSLASNYEEASEAYLYAMELIKNEKPLEILQSHIGQWAAVWNAGNIYLEGPNIELAKVTAGSLYYLLSSLPFQEIDAKRRRFYGLSPGSLAHGAARDYHGHSFWDTETWMFPPILLLWPNVAKDLLLYRMANAEAARENANATGYKGLRFPWESAFTGVDVTPDCCHETRDNQQHITADISFAARQYWAVTGDYSWLMGENYAFPLDINGCDFIHGMAEFWASRTTLNSETGQYEINGVMPPDEDHPCVNNSIYTNVGAAFSIFFAQHIKCFCNEFMSSNVPLEWVDIARKLKLPFDANHQYHPEFDGYSIGETIKQADAVLLGYPIMHVTDLNKRKNDLEIYENVTRDTGPAMSLGMYAIAHLDLGNEGKAEWLFNRSYQLYKMEPFKVWIGATSESGTVNFITGMGGFLQSLLSGYGGIRIHIDHLSFNPKLPRGINNFTIKGVNYKECSLDVAITQGKVRVAWTGESCQTLILTHWPFDVNGATAARLSYDQRNGTETGHGTMTFSRQRFTIQPSDPLPCNLPEDVLGQGSTSKCSSVGKASHTFLAIFLAIWASRSAMVI